MLLFLNDKIKSNPRKLNFSSEKTRLDWEELPWIFLLRRSTLTLEKIVIPAEASPSLLQAQLSFLSPP